MRGMEGILPRPPRLADESYLDFVETFRLFCLQKMGPVVQQTGTAALERDVGAETAIDAPLEIIKRTFNSTSIARSWQRMMRSHQEMMWRQVREGFLTVAEAERAALDKAAEIAPRNLQIDPDFIVPDYAREEIHLQPGGYTDDPIGGVVFHYGTKVFYEGMNDQDELHHELAGKMTLPADGQVTRILDVACSIGQATMALKKRFPEAEIIGLDVAAPMLRYAHRLSVERGLDITYRQGLCEATGYADNSFDCILSYILFHEIPVEVIKATAAEMFRILRPGGTFSIFEFPNHGAAKIPPAFRFIIDYDSRNNCEPYSPGFVYSDFRQTLADAGFEVSDGPKASNPFLQSLVCTKPA